MVLGTGVDLIEVERIRRALASPTTGERFRQRVFTPKEQAAVAGRRHPEQGLAARFAAKEAVMKALGRFCDWRQIEILREEGAPEVQLHGTAKALAASQGVTKIHLSLSHTRELATAFVVLEDASGS